jgi:hypothetical protein
VSQLTKERDEYRQQALSLQLQCASLAAEREAYQKELLETRACVEDMKLEQRALVVEMSEARAAAERAQADAKRNNAALEERFVVYSQEVESLVAVNKDKVAALEDALRRLHARVRPNCLPLCLRCVSDLSLSCSCMCRCARGRDVVLFVIVAASDGFPVCVVLPLDELTSTAAPLTTAPTRTVETVDTV